MIDLLEGNKNSSSIAIYQEDQCLSYKELNEIVNNFFSIIKPSTICIILGGNSINTIAFYLACLKRECIPLFLSQSISESHLQLYINNYKPSYIFDDSYEKHKDKNNSTYKITKLDTKLLKSRLFPTLLLTTSGSTGNPKVVKITKQNLLSNTKDIIHYLKITTKARHITTLPINYTYGLSCINTHLYSGGSIIANNSTILQKKFWDLVDQYKPNSISGVPYTYELLYRLGLNKLNLESIKTFTQAGGKLSSKILRHFSEYCNEKGKEFIVMYGQTEATARMSYLPYRDLESKIGSIGLALPSGRFSLINTSNYQQISGFEVGELIYKGPNVSAGYAKDFLDLAITGKEKDILNTGDLAYIDKEGFTYICGRKKRFAKLNGIRISLDDIERHISVHMESVAVSDDKFIYIFHENQISTDKVKESLKLFNIPISFYRFKRLKSFPRSPSGKILYAKLLSS